MTENEAIREFQNIRPHSGMIPVRMAEAVDTAIKALEEVQQYRQIGKISTCKNAVEICKAMIERGIDPDNIADYIKFEDNLMQRGYDLKRLLEMMEKYKQYCQIGTVEECRKSVDICKSMIERNITPENMEEYMKFEDECISKGFTFNSLLEAREKQTAKKPDYEGDGYSDWTGMCKRSGEKTSDRLRPGQGCETVGRLWK